MIRAASMTTATSPAGEVRLIHEDRYRRRAVLTTTAGEEFLLDLAEATELPDGAALLLDDGRQIVIRAAPEPLVEVRADDQHHLLRLTWHLGNRHLPVEILPGRLKIRRDHVLEDMLRQLGATLAHIEAPFQPEGGAYGLGRTHSHSHAHGPQDDPNAHITARHSHHHHD